MKTLFRLLSHTAHRTPHTAHRTPHTAFSVKTFNKGHWVPFIIMGFIASLLFLSCQKSSSDPEITKGEQTEIRSFCNPAGGVGCEPSENHSIWLTVDGCQLKVDFKTMRCAVSPTISRINIFDFEIDWSNSLPCTKIGLLNNAMPINGIGDWSPFFTLYNDLYKKVSIAAERFTIDFYGGNEQEDRLLDWWESDCQKVCVLPNAVISEPEIPSLPQWEFHVCSTEGCCFRNTIYVYDPITKRREIHAVVINPGGFCLPEIPITCEYGGSSCQEPCAKL